MRRILLLALFNLGFLYSHAQTSFGITAGFGTSKIRTPSLDDDSNDENRFHPAWRAGIMADIKLIGKLYLQPQLLISTKGDHTYSTPIDMVPTQLTNIHVKTRLTYLELPVNVVYKLSLGSGKFITGAGGYIAHGLGGRSEITGKERATGNDFQLKKNVKYKKEAHLTEDQYNKNDYYKPIDLGLNFLAGYEFKNGLGLNFTYSHGLSNLSVPLEVTTSGMGTWNMLNAKHKNSFMGVSVTYVLKKYASKA